MQKEYKILLNFGIWFVLLFVVCLIGSSNVFALEYTDIGYVHTLSGVSGEVTIDVTYETESGAPLVINRNQVIYTQLKVMNVFISNYSFEANRQYQVEMEFPYQQLQYANTYLVFDQNTNELCSLNYSESIFNSQWPRWNWSCPHATNSIYLKVYNSNNTAITSYGEWSWDYMYMRYTNTAISSDQQDTDIIINNNNMNTDRIIDNNNQNTDRIIDSNLVCKEKIYDINDIYDTNHYLNSSGVSTELSGYGVSNYIQIGKDSILKVVKVNGNRTCFYKSDKSFISCTTPNQLGNISIPTDSAYFRITFNLNDSSPILSFYTCTNGNQVLDDSINDLNDTLKDDSPVDISSLGNTAGWLPAGPIDSIINLPLNLFNNLLNALNKTCQPINIPLPYVNRDLPIPCISTIFNQIDGLPNFWNWVGVITSVVILYRYLLALYKYYDDLTTMKANFISDFGGAP